MKKIISLLLVMCMCSAFIGSAYAQGTPTIKLSSVEGNPGETVEVEISLENNPGIIAMLLVLNYDKNVMTLKNVTDSKLLPGQTHSPDYSKYPYTLYWENGTAPEDIVVDGVIATLTFEIAANAPSGSYPVSVLCEDGDILNFNCEYVDFDVQPGNVSLGNQTQLTGDINKDGKTNIQDVVCLLRHVDNSEPLSDLSGCDINKDGKINIRDVIHLLRYVNNSLTD